MKEFKSNFFFILVLILILKKNRFFVFQFKNPTWEKIIRRFIKRFSYLAR